MWNKDYLKCVECGGTSSKHVSKGLCNKCYLRYYRNNPENIKKIAAQKHEWYVRMGGKNLAKLKREERNFAGKREDILARDGHKCTSCPNTAKLTVHHIDGLGRGRSTPNNNDGNLITLCRACHARVHSSIEGWSRDYKCCMECGTTTASHNAKGYCKLCYSKLKRQQKI